MRLLKSILKFHVNKIFAPMKAHRAKLTAFFLGALLVTACQSLPETYPRRAESEQLSKAQRELIRQELKKRFGGPKSLKVPAFLTEKLGLKEETVLAGQRLFQEECAKCHGPVGDGNGRWIDARRSARDFTRGAFKFTSTGGIPTRDDLARIIRNGIPQSLMGDFSNLTEPQIQSLVQYIVFIGTRGVTELKLIAGAKNAEELTQELIKEEILSAAKPWETAKDRVIKPGSPRPEESPAILAEGKALFLSERAKCYDCHGQNGEGDGPGGQDIQDDWGNPMEPANLTLKEYRGGKRPIDIYYRIAGGLPGTPMPAMGKVLSSKEIWALERYLRSLED